MRTINNIIIHCSLSTWGDVEIIDKWHKERGWKGIGYHYVILNGSRTLRLYAKDNDGILEEGRPVENIGAHVKGMNSDTIGVCLIGDSDFTKKQFKALDKLLFIFCKEYKLKYNDILGHYETSTGSVQGKTCPNFDMNKYRRTLKWKFLLHYLWYSGLKLSDLTG